MFRPRSDFVFTPINCSILRQFECGSEPCLLLSKFFQKNAATVHETLFVILDRLQQIRASSFMMYADISHSEIPDLSKRTKTICVVSSNHIGTAEDGQVELLMEACIEYYRSLFAKDISRLCGLTNSNGDDVEKLPHITAMAALLNPLYGGKFTSFVVWLMHF